MHAAVVNVNIKDAETGTIRLRDAIVPQISAQPGFIAGWWIQLPDGKGTSVIVFESENDAQGVLNMIRHRQTVDDAVTIDSMEVGEVVAKA